ncbi:MAG: arsenate reductase ArsC [Bacteroidetes bacterium]|nr:arsenate reductase ArsC [Bacteroidota bacterium]
MDKTKVLFVCIHNSARSQMAEAFANALGKDVIQAESAGLEPGTLNPLVVKSMAEVEIDISGNKTKDVFDFFKSGKKYDYVITVCDEASGQRCPIFPGALKTLHWSFEDPSSFNGTEEEKHNRVSEVRDAIKTQVEEFIKSISQIL